MKTELLILLLLLVCGCLSIPIQESQNISETINSSQASNLEVEILESVVGINEKLSLTTESI